MDVEVISHVQQCYHRNFYIWSKRYIHYSAKIGNLINDKYCQHHSIGTIIITMCSSYAEQNTEFGTLAKNGYVHAWRWRYLLTHWHVVLQLDDLLPKHNSSTIAVGTNNWHYTHSKRFQIPCYKIGRSRDYCKCSHMNDHGSKPVCRYGTICVASHYLFQWCGRKHANDNNEMIIKMKIEAKTV